jgi:hypothetical protein
MGGFCWVSSGGIKESRMNRTGAATWFAVVAVMAFF